ncbi:MAG: hypothetical protein IPP96_00685 [Chitinophagaceae bacterium]|nr:hypothetical protein [Chitinophagaceae bacterium]
MRKLFLLIIAFFLFSVAAAQINSNLVLAAQPPAQLSEWGNRREVLMLILSAPGAVGRQFKIKAEIKTLDGTVIGSADLAKTTTFTSNPSGTTILFAGDVVPLEYMMFTGKYKTSLQRTGKLPADNYMLCVRLVGPTDYVPLGEEQCKTFYLASTQLPILIKPYNEEILDGKMAQTAITFRWTPVVPRPSSPVTYRLQVFEVLPTQSPVQALRSNQPLLDKEILAATQFIWQPQLAFAPVDSNETRKNPTFIWTIQSLDKDKKPITQTDGNGEGRSEPIIFYIGSLRKNN